ncbi:MAG: hypothetical protein KTR31_13025 [Myxococcales bacterium]|nr:hypothetical protein [Myxococcales bacterium]
MHRHNANEDLSAYLDGELTDAEAAELEAELARDPELRSELTELESVVQWMRQEGPDQAPLGFHRRVMDRIDAEHPEATPLWSWLRRPFGFPLEGWVMTAAAVAVLLMAIPWKPDTSVGEGWPTPSPEVGTPAALKLPEPVSEPSPPAVTKAGTAEGEAEVASAKDARFGTRPPTPVPAATEPLVAPKKDAPAKQAPILDTTAPAGEGEAPMEVASEETVLPVAAPGALATPGYEFVLTSDDANMKYRMLALAGQFGGARDLQGRPVANAEMLDSTEVLDVRLSQGDLTLFRQRLAKLGYDVAESVDEALLPPGDMRVRVTLKLKGGPPARKAMQPSQQLQLDDMEMAEPEVAR